MGSKIVRFDKKFLEPDPRYQNELASKMINAIMKNGKKTKAQNIFYSAMERFEKEVDFDEDESPIEGFEQAVENVKPKIEVRSRRVGGATYQVPMEVPPQRKVSLALRWIMNAARSSRKSRGVPMELAVAEELIDAYNQEGDAIGKRQSVHKMAEANKAFAHLAW